MLGVVFDGGADARDMHIDGAVECFQLASTHGLHDLVAREHAARAFGEWLAGVTGVAVEYFDERFTTSEADELLGSVKFTKKRRQARRDQLAAQIMLAAYLEAGGRGQESPGGIE